MSKKMLMVVLVLVLLFFGVLGGGFYVVLNKMTTLEHQIQTAGGGQGGHTAQPAESKKHEETETFNLDSLIVNLADGDGSRYLRVNMVLEIATKDALADVEKRKPQLKNIALMLLPTKSVQHLNSGEGKIALRDELMAKMNEILGKPIISDIFFTEFVIQ